MSARGLGVTAGLIALGLGVCHAMGLRDAVSVLSGTAAGGEAAALGGIAYVLCWMGAVVLAPVLAIAAIFQVAIGRVRSGRWAPPGARAGRPHLP